MSKTLQVGSEFVEYPTAGEGAGWGEEATRWAELVTDALKNVQGPNDILSTQTALNNNQTTPAPVTGLVFNTAQIQHIKVEFIIKREGTAGTFVESGEILGNFDGSNFNIAVRSVGPDTGVSLDVGASGQFIYTSEDMPTYANIVITYKAATIDQ